jgi:Flp pilus assembly protein TadD
MTPHCIHAFQHRGLFTPLALALGAVLLTGCATAPPKDPAEILFERSKARLLQGLLHQNYAKIKEAESEVLEAIRLKPAFAEAYELLGCTDMELRKYDEGFFNLRKAIELKPDLADAHGDLGVWLGFSGNLEEAIKEFRLAVRWNPDDPAALNNLASALDRMGRRKEAREFWERALKVEKKPGEKKWIQKRLAEPD